MTRLITRVGRAGWGDNRFRGHSVSTELLGRTTLSQLLALALGVELDAEGSEFFDELAVASTLADPHIWPLKLTRVAGVHGGSLMTGLASGLLATDGPLMGAGAVGPAASWLHDLAVARAAGADVLAKIRYNLANRSRMPGFGVPARRVDERVTAITQCVQARGRDSLTHWALWSAIVRETRAKGLEPNLASAFAAAALDLGFPVERTAAGMHICLLPSFLANTVEGADQRPEILRRVPDTLLEYRGTTRRQTRRSQRS